MTLQTKDAATVVTLQGGGGNQDGSPVVAPAVTPIAPTLPTELSSLGFKDANHVLQYISEVSDDAKKSKAMFKQLADGAGSTREEEISDDSFIREPKKATEAAIDRKLTDHFNTRIAPIATQLIEGNVQLQLRELKDDATFGPLLDDLRPELEAFLKNVPPQVKMQPGAVRKAMEMVAGQNFTKVAKKWNEVQARQAAGGAGGSNDSIGGQGGGGSASVGMAFAKLPGEEQEAARKQIKAGMFKDEADYVQWKNEDYEGGKS